VLQIFSFCVLVVGLAMRLQKRYEEKVLCSIASVNAVGTVRRVARVRSEVRA
jgi:hypothetical protein